MLILEVWGVEGFEYLFWFLGILVFVGEFCLLEKIFLFIVLGVMLLESVFLI